MTPGKSVAVGFVFIDGKYIAPPYRVTRSGIDICVNDQVVYRWSNWPLPRPIREDPGPPPPHITEKSTFEDCGDYLRRKFCYLFRTKPEDEALGEFLAALRNLPFCKSMSRREEEPDFYDFVYLSGKKTCLQVTGPRPYFGSRLTMGEVTGLEIVGILDHRRQGIEEGIASGGCYFLFGRQSRGKVFLDRARAARDLRLVVGVLAMDGRSPDKTRFLQRLGVFGDYVCQEQAAVMEKAVPAPADLGVRIDELIAETGITPRQWSDVPEKTSYERDMELVQRLRARLLAEKQAETQPDNASGATPRRPKGD